MCAGGVYDPKKEGCCETCVSGNTEGATGFAKKLAFVGDKLERDRLIHRSKFLLQEVRLLGINYFLA